MIKETGGSSDNVEEREREMVLHFVVDIKFRTMRH